MERRIYSRVGEFIGAYIGEIVCTALLIGFIVSDYQQRRDYERSLDNANREAIKLLYPEDQDKMRKKFPNYYKRLEEKVE